MKKLHVITDFVYEEAQRIFNWRCAGHKGKKPLDYTKAAEEAFRAAECFVEVGRCVGHLQEIPDETNVTR